MVAFVPGADSIIGGRADQAEIVDRTVRAGGHDIVEIDALAGMRAANARAIDSGSSAKTSGIHGAEIVDQDRAVGQVVIDTNYIACCRRDRAAKRVFDSQIAAGSQHVDRDRSAGP
jgi:hypothetical protein